MISKEKGEEVAGDRLLEGVTDKIFKDKWYYSNNRDSAHILARKILSLVCKRIEGVANPDIPMLRASQNIRETIVRLYDYYKAGSLPSEIYQDLVKSSGIIQADIEIHTYQAAFGVFRQAIIDVIKEE